MGFDIFTQQPTSNRENLWIDIHTGQVNILARNTFCHMWKWSSNATVADYKLFYYLSKWECEKNQTFTAEFVDTVNGKTIEWMKTNLKCVIVGNNKSIKFLQNHFTLTSI